LFVQSAEPWLLGSLICLLGLTARTVCDLALVVQSVMFKYTYCMNKQFRSELVLRKSNKLFFSIFL